MNTLPEILAAANSLSTEERAQLLEALWKDITPQDWPPVDDAWQKEVQRRDEQVDSGTTEILDWTDVRKKARREAGLDG